MIGISIADFIKASGHARRTNRPDTWLQPDHAASLSTCTAGAVHTWVFHSADAVVHTASPTRGAVVVREMMDGHRPAVWISDRYTAQQGHAAAHQTCLAHLARDVAFVAETSDDPVPWRLQL